MHFGIVSPPVPGHIHPFGALGRELIRRGHRVTFFHMPDLEDRVRREGLEFIPVGERDHPRGSLPRSLAALGKRHGLSALRYTIGAVARTTEMMLRDAPAAIRRAEVSALLVDQTEPAGAAIAEHLGMPFITVANALALNREPDVPPPFTPWRYRPTPWARTRNHLGYAMSDGLTRPLAAVVARQRKAWKLPPHGCLEDSFSPLAQICQQPPLFDFPRRRLPSTFHYVGPLRGDSGTRVDFPWHRLDGRPLIYASLGTLQNGRFDVFRCFAEACRGLDAQLVVTHGGGLGEREAAALPGNPLVVGYAPQLLLMARACLTLTHAGLNTVLDSLTFGVPVVAIPIAYEQPAIAERVRFTGAGETLPLRRLSPRRLREAIDRILAPGSSCAARAGRIGESIRQAGGATRAAQIILDKTTR